MFFKFSAYITINNILIQNITYLTAQQSINGPRPPQQVCPAPQDLEAPSSEAEVLSHGDIIQPSQPWTYSLPYASWLTI